MHPTYVTQPAPGAHGKPPAGYGMGHGGYAMGYQVISPVMSPLGLVVDPGAVFAQQQQAPSMHPAPAPGAPAPPVPPVPEGGGLA